MAWWKPHRRDDRLRNAIGTERLAYGIFPTFSWPFLRAVSLQMLVSRCKYLIVVLCVTVAAAAVIVVVAAGYFFCVRTCTFFAPSRRNWIRVFVVSISIHRTRVIWIDTSKSKNHHHHKTKKNGDGDDEGIEEGGHSRFHFWNNKQNPVRFLLEMSDNFKPHDSASFKWGHFWQNVSVRFKGGIYQRTIRQIVNTQNFYLTSSSQLHCIWFISYNNTWNAFNTHNGEIIFLVIFLLVTYPCSPINTTTTVATIMLLTTLYVHIELYIR